MCSHPISPVPPLSPLHGPLGHYGPLGPPRLFRPHKYPWTWTAWTHLIISIHLSILVHKGQMLTKLCQSFNLPSHVWPRISNMSGSSPPGGVVLPLSFSFRILWKTMSLRLRWTKSFQKTPFECWQKYFTQKSTFFDYIQKVLCSKSIFLLLYFYLKKDFLEYLNINLLKKYFFNYLKRTLPKKVFKK